jgi:hypothetical protein
MSTIWSIGALFILFIVLGDYGPQNLQFSFDYKGLSFILGIIGSLVGLIFAKRKYK